MKVTELSNKQLDYWVAKAQGWLFCSPDGWDSWCDVTGMILHDIPEYHPSTNWQQAGELVEKFKIKLYYGSENKWTAIVLGVPSSSKADTPTRAICMAVIASVYGDELNGHV